MKYIYALSIKITSFLLTIKSNLFFHKEKKIKILILTLKHIYFEMLDKIF